MSGGRGGTGTESGPAPIGFGAGPLSVPGAAGEGSAGGLGVGGALALDVRSAASAAALEPVPVVGDDQLQGVGQRRVLLGGRAVQLGRDRLRLGLLARRVVDRALLRGLAARVAGAGGQ